MMGGTEVLTPIGVADAARQGSTSPVMAQQAAAAAGGIDPALLAALQSMGLGSGGMPEVRLEVGASPGSVWTGLCTCAGYAASALLACSSQAACGALRRVAPGLPLTPILLLHPQQGLDVSALAAGMGLSRRSIDNNALGSMARHHLSSAAGAPAPGNTDFLAAAAAALAGGGGLGGGGMQVPTSQPPSMLNHNIGGSLPTQSFMAAAAALARSSGQPSSPQARLDEDRTLSLDQ